MFVLQKSLLIFPPPYIVKKKLHFLNYFQTVLINLRVRNSKITIIFQNFTVFTYIGIACRCLVQFLSSTCSFVLPVFVTTCLLVLPVFRGCLSSGVSCLLVLLVPLVMMASIVPGTSSFQ